MPELNSALKGAEAAGTEVSINIGKGYQLVWEWGAEGGGIMLPLLLRPIGVLSKLCTVYHPLPLQRSRNQLTQ